MRLNWHYLQITFIIQYNNITLSIQNNNFIKYFFLNINLIFKYQLYYLYIYQVINQKNI